MSGAPAAGRAPATADSTAAAAQAAAAEAYRNTANTVGGHAYTSNQNKYLTWVSEQRRLGNIPANGPLLTRENVDLFFSTVMVNDVKWVRPSMQRMVASLQALANYRTHAGQRWIVDSPFVQEMINV